MNGDLWIGERLPFLRRHCDWGAKESILAMGRLGKIVAAQPLYAPASVRLRLSLRRVYC